MFFAWIPPGHRLLLRRLLLHSRTHLLTSLGRRSTESFLAAFCVTGAVHRVFSSSWPAAVFCVAGAVYRAFWWSCGARGRHCLLRGRRNIQSLLAELRRAWPPLARGCLLRGRHNLQNFYIILDILFFFFPQFILYFFI